MTSNKRLSAVTGRLALAWVVAMALTIPALAGAGDKYCPLADRAGTEPRRIDAQSAAKQLRRFVDPVIELGAIDPLALP